MSTRSLSNYMDRWGLTCQRPTKQAYGQDIARVEKFKKEEFPKIKELSKEENADIFWCDETGISNTENFERGFAQKGKTPVLRIETKKERLNNLFYPFSTPKSRESRTIQPPIFLLFLLFLLLFATTLTTPKGAVFYVTSDKLVT